jgi:hypothetical protein
MGRRPIMCLCLVALLLGLTPSAVASADGASYESAEPGFTAGFNLDASNGYSIFAYAYSERPDGRGRITFSVGKKGESAFYSAPATVTSTSVYANLGHLGKIDVAFHPSGREETARLCGRLKIPYEPGYYEGTLEFNGEEGYTRASETRVPLRPLPFPNSICGGRGSGEETGSLELPGARLRGLSFAGGRSLSFQVNKNRPRAPAHFSVSLSERRDGIRIEREVKGEAPPASFAFGRSLRTAKLAPPSPFSGSALLSRGEDSFSPIWKGGLTIDLPGKSGFPLAGPGVHVSLVHARFTNSPGSFAQI